MSPADRPPIQCGDHLLTPEVIIDCGAETVRPWPGTRTHFKDATMVIVRCQTCGRETRINEYLVQGLPLPERTWP